MPSSWAVIIDTGLWVAIGPTASAPCSRVYISASLHITRQNWNPPRIS